MAVDVGEVPAQSPGLSKGKLVMIAIGIGGVIGLFVFLSRKKSGPVSMTNAPGTAYTSADLSAMSIANDLSQFRGEYQAGNADVMKLISGTAVDTQTAVAGDVTASQKGILDSIASLLGVVTVNQQATQSSIGDAVSSLSASSASQTSGLAQLLQQIFGGVTDVQHEGTQIYQLLGDTRSQLGQGQSQIYNLVGQRTDNLAAAVNQTYNRSPGQYQVYGVDMSVGGGDAGNGNGSEWYSLHIPTRVV